jgi:hypothetical protein
MSENDNLEKSFNSTIETNDPNKNGMNFNWNSNDEYSKN